jgi:methylmalonyl-CoA mutase cobalamin-binding subunit
MDRNDSILFHDLIESGTFPAPVGVLEVSSALAAFRPEVRMRDVGNLVEDGRGGDGYVDLALEVIRRLAHMRVLGGEALQEVLVTKLFDAVKSDEAPFVDEVARELLSARVTHESVVIDYIPEVARRLGVAWEKDTLSFSVVTTGAMKLQRLLHHMALGSTADGNDGNSSATVLLLVPMGEQHTLGAMTAAAWLRMKGVSVCLKIAPNPQELSMILQAHRFDGVFVSVGSDSRVDVCAKLVKALRALTKGALPVVFGGPLAEKKRDELLSIGADFVTIDLAEALAFVSPGQRKKRRNTG